MMPVSLDAAAGTVLSWLLTYAVHSTILLAIAALVAWRFAEHHAWLDQIWKAALFAPLLTASVQLDPMTFPIATRYEMPPVARVAPAAPVERAAPVGNAEPVAPASPAAPVARAARVAPAFQRWPLVAAAAWLLVAPVSVLRYLLRLRRVYRVLGAGAPNADANLIEPFTSKSIVNRSIRLSTNDQCPVPLALSRGHIVVPPRFHDELDAEQQHAALAHEVAHVIRRDPEWRIAVEILERALFFQPFNRFARARLCDSAEFLCDEWAVRHTQSPLALARCLSIVASWWSPADALPAGVSAMARSESAMVKRVTRILDAPSRIVRPRLFWLAIPVALVAFAAPRITAAHLPAPIAAAVVTAGVGETATGAAEQRDMFREWTQAEIDAARAQLRVNRFDKSGTTLKDRWFQAMADAGKRGVNEFWLVYTFNSVLRSDEQVISDTLDGNSMSFRGTLQSFGPPLSDVINQSSVPLEGGNLAVLLHYRGARPDGLNRAGYRSVELGFNFGRTPVYWLGNAPEAESFERARELFTISRDRKIQLKMVDLASLHADSNVVIPFLTSLVESSRPPDIRAEAAEGFERHHDRRSVEVLLRVARNDTDAHVRGEAAEAIGEVQTPESIPALTTLVSESDDTNVRHEAAEGFGSQPAAQAIPAIERVIATSQHEDVLNEAIEALGDLGDPAALQVLVEIANSHASRQARVEAVETIGDLGGPGAVDALTRLAYEHLDVNVQVEAVETLGDRREDAGALAAVERIAREHDREAVQTEAIETLTEGDESSLHPLILELAVNGRSLAVRKEALDSIGEALDKISDLTQLDRVQAVLERVAFDDVDRSVQMDALDAANHLPDDRARRLFHDIIARHPDSRVRKEAEEHVRERQ